MYPIWQCDDAFVVSFVTCFTQCYEIVRCISSGFSTFNVMHIQDVIFGFSFAALTGMSIPKQHIFTYIPEIKLFSVLVSLAFDLWVFNLLDVKTGCFDYDFCHRKDLHDVSHDGDMSLNLLSDTRSEPPVRFLPVIKTRLSIPGLSAPATVS